MVKQGTWAGWKQRTSRRTTLLWIGAGAAAFVAACSGTKEQARGALQTQANRAGLEDKGSARQIIGNNWNAVDGTPRYGGVLRFAPISPVLASLDPILSASAMVHNVVTHGYSRLIKIGRKPENRNEFVIFPDAADRWEIADPTTLVFHLRDGIKFHNVAPVHGRALVANDVKYSIERSASNTSQFAGAFTALDSVQIPDNKTVVVKLKRYDATLLRNLAGHAVWLVPHELAEGSGLKNAIVGTGPFIFERWEQDSAVYFRRNPDYFIKGVPFVDELQILIIANEDARATAFQSGQVIYWESDSERLVQRMKSSVPNVKSEPYTLVSPYVLFMNFKEPVWRDVRVRRAISLALDPDTVIRIADAPGLWRGVISNQHPGWSPSQEELKSTKFYLRWDVAEAKKLLSAAGYPDGFTTELMFNSSYPQVYQSVTQYLQQALAQVGVRVELRGFEHATFRRNQDIQNYRGLIHGLDGQGQPEAYLLDYRTGGPKNGSGLSDPELDQEIDAVTAIVDEEQRKARALEIQRKLLMDVLYKIAFRDSFATGMWHPWVKNLWPSPPHFYATTELDYVWLEK